MQEESKEEYIARHRKALGKEAANSEVESDQDEPAFIEKLKKWLYIALLLTFVWGIYQIFGMMDSN